MCHLLSYHIVFSLEHKTDVVYRGSIYTYLVCFEHHDELNLIIIILYERHT